MRQKSVMRSESRRNYKHWVTAAARTVENLFTMMTMMLVLVAVLTMVVTMVAVMVMMMSCRFLEPSSSKRY